MKEALFTAIENGDLKTARFLIKQGCVDANSTDFLKNDLAFHETALYKACCTPHLSIVKALIKAGADVNLGNQRGVTPLMAACLHQRKRTVEELLRRNADIKRISDFGGALSYAVEGKGNIQIIKRLIKAGVDLNERDDMDQTPLFCVCRKGRIDLVTLLLEAGADPNARDESGMSVLQYLCSCNWQDINPDLRRVYPKIVKLLIENKADVNAHDEFRNVLTTACDTDAKNAVKIVKMLLDAGARVSDYVDCKGRTVLDVAKKWRNKTLIALLRQEIIKEKGTRHISLATPKNKRKDIILIGQFWTGDKWEDFEVYEGMHTNCRNELLCSLIEGSDITSPSEGFSILELIHELKQLKRLVRNLKYIPPHFPPNTIF